VVLIGPVENSNLLKNLVKLKNAYYLGSVPYQELPEFIKKFDVCMIPHMVNKLTASMNPLKLFEFLATGKPIVSTNIGGVDQFLDIIFVAQSEEDFIQKLQKALNGVAINDKENRLKERNYICGNRDLRNSQDSRAENQ
jgi:glycosyltransferase involved in cell wall biosynthesis